MVFFSTKFYYTFLFFLVEDKARCTSLLFLFRVLSIRSLLHDRFCCEVVSSFLLVYQLHEPLFLSQYFLFLISVCFQHTFLAILAIIISRHDNFNFPFVTVFLCLSVCVCVYWFIRKCPVCVLSLEFCVFLLFFSNALPFTITYVLPTLTSSRKKPLVTDLRLNQHINTLTNLLCICILSSLMVTWF